MMDISIKMTVKLICLIIILLLIFLIWHFRPRYVELEVIAAITNPSIDINVGKENFSSEFHWWFIDGKEDLDLQALDQTMSPDINQQLINSYPDVLLNWGIDFDALEIDFDQNNVILAFSREIKEMKFKRADFFPYKIVSTVKTVMSKKFSVHTIYVYKIPKYDVREDLKAYTETDLEK